MGYILDDCPQVQDCCCCVPLRHGAITVGILGLLLSAMFFYGFTSHGMARAEERGLPRSLNKIMRYFSGISGVLLAAVHVLLIFAGVYESDSLCEVYIWFMVFFWVILVIVAAAVCVCAVLDDNILFACLFLLGVAVFILVSFYFLLVVANFRMTLP
ncbi:uncharacterized protein LOC123701006 [Colias croceus]|uniref:uncharacterized protein LOC123701006 n=1 Tax=Colias crocea TaxID=72248 RepID=UPI001E281688|nr:uncharacterized protein LOC123701006 [Colias croceus]